MRANETLPLNFQVQGRNQNTLIPGNCLTTPAHEIFPEFFESLNNPLRVVDAHTCHYVD